MRGKAQVAPSFRERVQQAEARAWGRFGLARSGGIAVGSNGRVNRTVGSRRGTGVQSQDVSVFVLLHSCETLHLFPAQRMVERQMCLQIVHGPGPCTEQLIRAHFARSPSVESKGLPTDDIQVFS